MRLREDERSVLAASSIIVIFGAATLIGTHFSADVAAYVMRYAGHEDMHIIEQESRLANKGSRKSTSVAQRRVEPDQASAPAQAQQAQVQQVAAVSVPEAQQSLMDRAEGLAQEPAEARRATEGLDVQLQAEAAKSARSLEEAREKAAELAQEVAARNELAASTEQHRQTLAEERDRSAAQASEPATAQWNAETRVVQSNKTANEAAQLKAAISVAFSETQRERERAEALASELAKLRRVAEAAAAVSSQKNDEAVQQKQTAESTITELRQSLQQEQKKSATLMREAKAAQAMTASAEQQRRALEEAQARAAALASELTGTRREIEAQAAQSQKAVDAATKEKQTAESTITELRQSLQQEQEKTATVMQETKAAQATTASAEQQRRALEEARARAAALASELAGTRREMESWDVQSRTAEDAAAQQKQATEREIVELRQSLQQEPDRAEAMARDFASARCPIDERVTVQRAVEGPIVPVTQPVAAAVTEPPDVREKTEAARLLARAGSLIARGNIGAARVVLERAGESGNARASFMLAETYDPAILLAWGTYGTRGDAAKARELYTKAHAGGIQEAKERLSALRQ